jgi:hypothetical protein
MADDDKKSFFATLPGLLTAIAALIGALTTLYIALHHDGQHHDAQPDSTKVSHPGKTIDTSIHHITDQPQPQPSPKGDQFKVISILPSVGTTLSGQQDFYIDFKVHYILVSTDSVRLVPYIVQFAYNDECATGAHRLISDDDKDYYVKIKQGEGDVNVKVHYRAGKYTTTGPYGSGNHISLNAALVPAGSDSQNSRSVIQMELWSNKDFCYPFQPQ